MKWEKLLCEERQCGSSKKDGDERNEFQRDYHRIIGSASFRRLQDKTQVFPLDKSDFVRTRLTHSLEVSSFAKSLGQSSFRWLKNNWDDHNNLPDDEEIVKICSILECAGLIHDIGNPPFGHFGEYTVRMWFRDHLGELVINDKAVEELLTPQMKNDLLNYEGNAQALRLLTKLHYLVDEKGMHLTYGLLNTIIKYPVDSMHINKNSGNIKNKKMGYYYAEDELFKTITASTGAESNRYPLVYLLEAADDIAYSTADIEDAVKKGYLSYDELLDELVAFGSKTIFSFDKEKEQYNNAIERLKSNYDAAKERKISDPELNAVQNWIVCVQGVLLRAAQFGFTSNYHSIMRGDFRTEIISAEKSIGKTLIKALKDIATKYVFCSSHIMKLELSAANILNFLLKSFVPAVLKIDDEKIQSETDKRLISIISENYKNAYKTASADKSENEKIYLRLLLVTDFICGMTDTYAKDLYLQLSGMSL